MDPSAPRSALFAPRSPEEKWLETVLHEAAPRQGGRRTSPPRQTDLPAVTPSSAARQLFSPSLKPTLSPQSSQSPESANAAVGKATVWSAPRGDASSIVPTHSSSQTPGSLPSVVVFTEPLPQAHMIPASPAAAAADTELHAWLEQIAAKKAELSAATAAAATASKELAALEAGV